MPTIPSQAIYGKRSFANIGGTSQGATVPPPLAPPTIPGNKLVVRLTTVTNAEPISNEVELVGRPVVVVRKGKGLAGSRGKIVRVITAERAKEPDRTKGHRDVFYTVETANSYITGLMWQDFLQLPRP